jgi:hypothetical protein
MKPLRLLPALCFIAGLIALAPVSAQPPPSPGRAIFYTEPGYRGESLVVEAGAVAENLEFIRDRRGRPLNDRISSVRFEGPVRAALFEHSQFRGAFTWISRDIPDLSAHSLGDQRSGETWNENVSSIQVQAVEPGPRDFIQWERRDAERAVRATYRDYLGRDPDAQGLRFYTGRLMDAGWSEEQLRDAFRRSDEFRNRDVDAIIRKTYREVLGRDPDPSGLASYRRGLGRGMTEPQMRAELARSREGVEARVRETITRVYREMLKRDPDADGLAAHTKAFLEKGWDEGRLRDAIRKSEEYRRIRGN